MAEHSSVMDYVIDPCQVCRGRHQFALLVTLARGTRPPVYFGGETDSDDWSVTFSCPRTGQPFVEQVRPATTPGIAVISVEVLPASAPAMGAADSATPSTFITEEVAEKARTSQAAAGDFCRTMISVCAGAIPVFFAVLKYLGHETSTSAWWALSAVSPALLFVATAIFAMTLRPVLMKPETYQQAFRARDQRLEDLDKRITVGIWFFLAGVASAVVVWTVALIM